MTARITISAELVILLIATVALLLGYPKPTHAQTYYFNEEFNQNRPANTLDNTLWEYFNSAPSAVPTIQESNGSLKLTQLPNTFRFPYIVSKLPALPPGDFSTEIKFQYTKVTPWGTGFSLSDNKPVNGSVTSGSLLSISVWQDQTLGPNMRIHFNSTIVHTIPITTAEHLFRVDRLGSKYFLYLDNQLVYTSPETNLTTKYIWLGHYGIQDPPVPDWTTFNIDYIRVIQPGPTPAPTPTPTPIPTPTPTPSPQLTPVIFIPGIEGSELKTVSPVSWSAPNGHGGTYLHSYESNEKIWINTLELIRPGFDDYFDILRFKSDGLTPEANLGVTGNLVGPYQETIEFFNNNGYTSGINFFTFAYDWRRDLTHTETYLNELINQVMTQTGAVKVDIVAHSMGGLVARNYIKTSSNAAKVRKLIELGVPHLGSVNTIRALHYGDCLTFKRLGVCLTLNQNELKELVQNMITSFQLAPSKTYFSIYDGSETEYPMPFNDLADLDSNGIAGTLNYDETKKLLSNFGHNTDLFNYAETFHQIDNNLSNTNGVDTTIITGSGMPTLGQIIEKNSLNIFGIRTVKKDQILINGDNTVPLLSSSLNAPQKNFSISGSAKVFYTNQDHTELIADGPALNTVINSLSSNSSLPLGVSFTPTPLKGKLISVHSPITLDLYDQNGNHTGINQNGDIEQNIPGTVFNTLDDAKFIWIPDDGVYQIKMTATDNGSFDFKIRNFNNNLNDKTTIYQNIPITAQSKADLTYYSKEPDAPIMHVDQNGDGTIDQNIIPTKVFDGPEQIDQTPPEARIFIDLNKMDLIVEGIDESATFINRKDNPNTKKKDDAIYTIRDQSNNTLTLDVRDRDKDKKDTFRIYSLQYNTNLPVVLDPNKFNVTYKGKKERLNVEEQNYEQIGDVIIRIKYDQKKDQSEIITQEKGTERINNTKTGLLLLQLQTKNGELIPIY